MRRVKGVMFLMKLVLKLLGSIRFNISITIRYESFLIINFIIFVLIPLFRIFYCISIVLWYVRFLKYLSVIEYWGSKIIIMTKIVNRIVLIIFFQSLKFHYVIVVVVVVQVTQLGAFITLIMIFVLSFGVGFQSIVRTEKQFNYKLFKKFINFNNFKLYKTVDPTFGVLIELFNRVYWPIFGDFSFLDEIQRI